RGDAKGIVERNFRTIQATFKPFAPGVVTETRTKKRGGKDYRLDAKLTVTEFKEIILSSVLVRNQYDCLKKYDRGIDMPPDLPMTPLSIWNWGLQNRTGRLRPAAEDALRVSLLPREKVTLSDLGACMFGIYFTSPELISRGWLHRSKEATRPASMVAAYDPASADNIYVFPHKNSVEYWICNLAERSREFKGCSFWDVWQVQDMQKRTMANNKLLADKKKRDHETFVEKKIENAISRAPADPGMTKAERLLGIRENRDKAKQEERRESAYRPESQRRNEPASVIPITKQEDNDYSYPDHLDELFDDED
ncbi:MAG: Mu transposase C-terminal domain-containing protein, partial [Candidatus Thiodiazotropha sp. (ex Lucinoma borealis)]|nr:Mu transposase C-terminal domain-containing protein [Candidatus Thiodiazotropha sp. (ex Lucinoma borealis)]